MVNSIEQLENGTVTDKIIEIKSVYKNGKTTVTPTQDPMTGGHKGIERLSEDEKRQRKYVAEPTDKFILKDGVVFDLNKEQHKVIWGWVKYQSALAFSYEECQSRPEAEFYIYLRDKEASDRVSIKELKYKAMKFIMEDNPVNYTLRCKLLGVNMDSEPSQTVIKDFLLEQAQSNPEGVVKVYEDKMSSLRMLLLNALERNIVKIDPNGAYRYGNIIIGMSEDSVVSWMNNPENKQSVRLLEAEVNPEYFEENKPKKNAKLETSEDGPKELTR